MLNTHDVFGLSANYRPLSYVDRGNLDTEVLKLLSRDIHIAIRGESKCGKSWMRQKNIPDAIVIQCRLNKTVNDIYIDALSQLDIKLVLEKNETGTIRGKISAQGSFGKKLLASLGFKTEIEASDSTEARKKRVGHDVEDLRFVADIIKESNRRLVIEDFHYLDVKERKKFAFDLKALWDYGVFVTIIGVWSQNNLLIYLNPDLSGRVHEISIEWSANDLKRVLDIGGKHLKILFSEEIKNKIVSLCYGNVGILQKLTLEMLDRKGITTKRKEEYNFDDIDALETAALFYAEQLNPLYQQFAKRVSRGIRARQSSTGIYAHAMAVILDADDDKLINGLHVDEIFTIANSRQPRIQKGNLKAILEKIDGLQVDEEGRGLIVTYNIATEEVTVIDKQLLLYRKYCTVKWPWEDIIAEVDKEKNGEQSASLDRYSAGTP